MTDWKSPASVLEYTRQWRQANRERMKAHARRYRERNLAKVRERAREYARKKWAADPEPIRRQRRLYAMRLRDAVIAAYGGKCACCPEAEPKFLSIDHIYNDGHIQRKVHGMGGRFYRFLRARGFPKDQYQLLCHNCNGAKAYYGQCPHKENVTND